MKVFVGSLLLIFLVAAGPKLVPGCDGLQYELTVHPTTNGFSNGRIEVKVIKSTARVRAFLFSQNGGNKKANKLDVKLSELTGLAAGTYTLVLQDKKCSVVERDLLIK